ncbi:3-dehydroquinate synthase family protein [Candidatus Carsonella ruddii]|uniref:3-dehydroquinate synthase n=1 Tax=Candidatus Carsonella ruddii HC isolate Thao2000 TaxID=1202538 RepID=J3YPX8_CARRU|nr:3-dehydroquinate synthase [Candidatus Carsonella ruddii]AFP83883.1 3-dehydroquinate synthase [Candidatus Carsonella ruddii HC isolate Thao2000]
MKIIKTKKKFLTNIYINSYFNINIFKKNNIFIIIDYNIYILLFSIFKKKIKKFKFVIIPFGEKYKNINTLKIIWKYMIKKNINKNFLITIFGGGVLGDIIGFVCSSYFRGISFSIFPTTLLSQIDSSIGGKNAVNFFSKNSIGIINNPIYIYINYNIIFFMKKNEFFDGYSEIIKYSIINNKKFFFYIYKKKNIKKIISRSCYIKSKIISQDYYEFNYRSILNLGHTYAHCIENNKIINFSHGKSVTIGIIFCYFLSSYYYKLNLNILKKNIFLFLKLNFFIKNSLFFSKKMINKIILDKKFNNKINFILIKNIGNCVKKNIKKNHLLFFLKKFYEI